MSDPAGDQLPMVGSFRTVADALGIAAVVVDRAGKLVATSGRFDREIRAVSGGESLDAVVDDDARTVADRLASWFGSATPRPTALTIDGVAYRCDGARLAGWDLAVVRFARRDEAVHPFVQLTRAVDVDRLQRTKQRLRGALQELEQANAALHASNQELDRFASVVAHDLRSPLVTISTAAAVVADRDGLDPEGSQLLAMIGRNVERMLRQIDALLRVARSGSSEPPAVPVPLADVLDAVRERLGSQLEEAGAELAVDVPAAVLVSETELVQLFENLLGNALKFRRPDRPLRIEVRARTDGGRATVTVSDNGIGIPGGQRERVFDVFVRGDVADRPGSGVGLATCRRIVNRHGGSIALEDGIEGGTAVRFDLPAGAATAG